MVGVKCLQGVAEGWDYTWSVCWDQGRSLSVVCRFSGGQGEGGRGYITTGGITPRVNLLDSVHIFFIYFLNMTYLAYRCRTGKAGFVPSTRASVDRQSTAVRMHVAPLL